MATIAQVQRQLNISNEDMQVILNRTMKEYEGRISLLFLDCSYLYNFHLDDFDVIRRFNILGRYDKRVAPYWHQCLERWYSGQTVVLEGRTIKPLNIVRSFDRVVNEGLEMIAACLTGGDSGTFPFRSIGDGVVPLVLPSDRILANEIDRIDVNDNPDGGSLSRDGSTIYSIGNHSKGIPTANLTECGMHNTGSASTDEMLDHSKFATAVPHVQDVDGPGSTTVIYMCSG